MLFDRADPGEHHHHLSAEHIPFLQDRVDTIELHERRAPVPYIPMATVPYYVAIIDPNRNILAKEVFTQTLVFPPNTSQASSYDETTETIPLPKNQSAERYGIAVGMQLTPAELEYNRSRILH